MRLAMGVMERYFHLKRARRDGLHQTPQAQAPAQPPLSQGIEQAAQRQHRHGQVEHAPQGAGQGQARFGQIVAQDDRGIRLFHKDTHCAASRQSHTRASYDAAP